MNSPISLARFLARSVRNFAHTVFFCQWLAYRLSDVSAWVDSFASNLREDCLSLLRPEENAAQRDMEIAWQESLRPMCAPTPEAESEIWEAKLILNETLCFNLPEHVIEPLEITLSVLPGHEVQGAWPCAGGKEFHHRAGLLAAAFPRPNVPPLQLAYQAYSFVRQHREHGPPPAGSLLSPLVVDPLLFFNLFGFGLCAESSVAFAGLCREIGLPCRVRNITRHVFPEVLIDGRWVIFDSDGAMLFGSAQSSGHLLSYSELQAEPATFRAIHADPVYEHLTNDLAEVLFDEDLHELFTVAKPNGNVELAESLGLSLHEGMIIRLVYGPGGPWHSGCPRIQPAPFAAPKRSANIIETLDLLQQLRGNPNPHRGLHLQNAGESGSYTTDGSDARIDFERAGAYPLLDGTLECSLGGDSRPLQVFVGLGSGRLREITGFHKRTSPDGTTLLRYGLRRALLRASPGDMLHLRILLPGTTQVHGITLELTRQASFYALPRFVPKNNTLTIRGNGTPGAALKIQLRYRAALPCAQPTSPRQPTPADGANLSCCQLESFRWGAPGMDEGQRHFLFQLFDAACPGVPLASNFDRTVTGTEWSPEPHDKYFLHPGRRYAWRVTMIDDLGTALAPPSDFAFTLDP